MATINRQVLSSDKNLSYYSQLVPELSPTTREVLEQYSKIPSDKLIDHCVHIRDTAWEVFPYPCVGSFRFLDLSVSHLPAYKEIIDRLKTQDNVLLDLGCCFGQDIRRLVYDGAPQQNIYGADLRIDFINLGYDLFLDKDTLKVNFMEADVFDENSALKQLHGKVDIIVTSAFFHLFDREQQKAAAHHVIKLLKPKKDSLLVGRQVGNENPGNHQHRTNTDKFMFRHNPESWKELWKEIGEETGTKWEVYSAADSMEEVPNRSKTKAEYIGGDIRWLVFAIRRIE